MILIKKFQSKILWNDMIPSQMIIYLTPKLQEFVITILCANDKKIQ